MFSWLTGMIKRWRFISPPPASSNRHVQVKEARRLSPPQDACKACQAGALISFSWEPGVVGWSRPPKSVFVSAEKLRRGTLFFCKICGHAWHLDEHEKMMSVVSGERLPLIREWNKAEIRLPSDAVRRLKEIGETPADIYGNGREYREIPCGVVTLSGERIDLSIVSSQSHAPFEDMRRYRLGTEIREIYSSPFALPLDVRVGTARAEEMRMGFSPALMEMTDGKLFVVNGRTNFLVKQGYRAVDARPTQRRVDMNALPEFADSPHPQITYFVCDPW